MYPHIGDTFVGEETNDFGVMPMLGVVMHTETAILVEIFGLN